MIVLGLDPGKTTGFAFLHFDVETLKSSFVDMGEWTKEQCFQEMDEGFRYTPKVVVIEDFELRPNSISNNIRRTKGFVALPVPKLIGAFEYWSHLTKSLFIEQSPSEKPFGYTLTGVPYNANMPGTHIFDAQAHAAVYVHRHLGGFKYVSSEN